MRRRALANLFSILLWCVAALLLVGGCSSQRSAPKHSVTFRVLPKSIPPNSVVHLTGNQVELGEWKPDFVQLEKQSDGSWTKTIAFEEGSRIEFKITRGSWRTEAVDTFGLEYPNFAVDVAKETTVVVSVADWRDTFRGETVLSTQRFRNKAGNIELFNYWRYRSGDDSLWASPLYDDSSWEEACGPMLSPNDSATCKWNGIGWFRLHLIVDSTLWNVPMGLSVRQAGASEIYIDGKLTFRLGRVGRSEAEEARYTDSHIRHFQLGNGSNHLLAVRFSNHAAQSFHEAHSGAGIILELSDDVNAAFAERSRLVRVGSVEQMIFTVVPICFAIVHLLMFVFYPRHKQNLYYGVCLLAWAALSFVDHQWSFVTDPKHLIWLSKADSVLVYLTLLFGVLAAYQNAYERIPKQYYLFVLVALVGAISSMMRPIDDVARFIFFAFLVFVGMEILRAFLVVGPLRKRGSVIIGMGSIVLVAGIVYQILMNLDIVPQPGDFPLVFPYGVLTFVVAVSIDFARKFALTNKELEQQITQLKELSAKTIEQERRAKEEEVARRLLEADNARKTKELEDARQVQLSMLPKRLPMIPNLDIAVRMETATEIGGDYYDFYQHDDGTLTVALGDATGHGTKAGTMVSVAKGLFHELVNLSDIPTIFERFTKAIKFMNLGQLYMALMLVRLKNHSLIASAAGMPPMFIFRSATKSVERVAMKGMPLGSVNHFPYQTKELSLSRGDTILLMSDGFLEMFNEKNETLDEEKAIELFREVGERSSEEIIAHLVVEGKKWANGRPQADDVTFVVMKVK